MKILVCMLLSLLSATQVSAQETPAFDISGGYALVHLAAPADLPKTFHGWLASVAGHLTPWFALVGDVGGNYVTVDDYLITLKLSTHTYTAGARLTLRRRSISPYAQVLVGAARLAVSGSEVGGVHMPVLSIAKMHFTIQPGGGIDVRLSRRLGFRAGADYRLRLRELRLHGGVVYRVGSR